MTAIASTAGGFAGTPSLGEMLGAAASEVGAAATAVGSAVAEGAAVVGEGLAVAGTAAAAAVVGTVATAVIILYPSEIAKDEEVTLADRARNQARQVEDRAKAAGDQRSEGCPECEKQEKKKGKRRKNRLPEGKGDDDLGPPDGTLEKTNPQTGEVQQIREYDSNGKPLRDVDYGHDHGAGDPHVHDWTYESPQAPNPSRGPGRPPTPGEIP